MNHTRFAARMERLNTIPGLRRDVSALVVLIVIGLISAGVIKTYLGGSAPWSETTVVRAEFVAIPGLNPSSQNRVTMAGVKVGSVTAAEATERGNAMVTMTLDGNYQVYSDARAVLRPKNPLNEMQVELNPGTPAGTLLTEDDSIPLSQTEKPVQADEILDHLDDRAQTAITDLLVESDVALARAPQHLPQGLSSTTSTLQAARPVVEALQTRREAIAQLVTALSQISASVGSNDERITSLASATAETLTVLGEGDNALRASLEQLPGLSDELRAALSSTQSLTAQLDPTLVSLDEASTALPSALHRFTSTVGELDGVIQAAKPVLERAVPVIADLRPTVGNLHSSLVSLTGVTGRLDGDTQTVMSYLTDINAFVYNTSSVFGAGDANGGIIRGHLMVPLPGAGVLPNSVKQGQGAEQ
jgi:phospholipid/cholesterol/gamma-HCH transport system substrate-binding protein